MKLVSGLFAIAMVCSSVFAAEQVQRTLTFEDRVAVQKAIEQVYWNHRIWPRENPTPKPPFEATITDVQIRARVDDYLRASSAYERLYGRAVSAAQLQAELARMSTDSRDPAALREMFAALGNDPLIIAECVARPALVDRLLRNGYARDGRFHGALRCKAEAALAAGSRVADTDRSGALYEEATWTLSADPTALPAGPTGGPAMIALPPDKWSEKLTELSDSLGAASAGAYGPPEETNDAFVATAVLESYPDRVKTATLIWPKRSFDDWWYEERAIVEPSPAIPQGSYTLAMPAQSTCTRGAWSPIRSGVPEARAYHTAVWTGSEMLVWGGSGFLSTGGRYNPATDTWAPMSTDLNVPTGRIAHRAVWTGTEMIVWGGHTTGASFNTGGRYNPATNSWRPTRADATAPTGRSEFSMVWTGTEMIVWGGDTGGPYTATGGRYDPVSDTWTSTSTGSGTPTFRSRHTAVWTGTEMIIWGGGNYLANLSDGGRYDPSSDTWRPIGAGPGAPSPRSNHLAVWTGSEMIVWGGLPSGSTYTNTGGRYDPPTDSWTATSTGANVPAESRNCTAVWSGSEMLVWGGVGGTGARYSPPFDSWRPISMAQAPIDRTGESAVWTGREMIVWGGRTTSSTMASETGDRYDPATDSWVPTSTGGDVPTPRYNHSAVWTGSEMIVWGGSDSINWTSTGGRYRPATDDWTPTSTASGVPQARRGQVAVWTGREMIVWGGDGNSPTFLQSGGRYDPVHDTWSATSLLGAPIGRTQPTVVWTGTEMIVFGGYDYFHESQPTDTGGRYDPARDSWSPTKSGAGGPGRRLAHSAVWTGNEMIVWGGDSPTDPIPGVRYDPMTNAWRPTGPSSVAPSARSGHSAVWDGRGMIVFGGYVPPFTNTGSRYDPSADAWTSILPASGTVQARGGHQVVWTGTEMIVWGGTFSPSDPVYTNTGGRYDLAANSWSPTAIDANTPLAHALFSTVWTGRSMILWGGTPAAASNGSYCGCPEGRLVYRDGDGDGFGNPAVTAPSCDGNPPAGYVLDATDCDDTNPTVHPGALEICNGVDDDCDGIIDNGGNTLCDDGNVCSDDTCNGTSLCTHSNNAAVCNDGNACTSGDICGGGTCHGVEIVCDDHNACNGVETCNPSTGCVAGTPLVCNDNNVCTTDSCNPATGCVFTNSTASCNDGNACTTNDICDGGTCHGGPPLNCSDGNCCTIDSCNPATGCVHTPNTAAPVFTHQPSLGACPTLWPPNHRYADFTVPETGATATSICGIASIRFASCSSSQPENTTGTGDGNTTRDCVYSDDTVSMRAERDGACSPTGRVYETTLVALDVCGNVMTSNPIDVGVYHDRGNSPSGGRVYSGSGNSQDVKNGTNGTYGAGCGGGNACTNGTSQDHSDADPEMEIVQAAAVSVDDLHINKVSGGNVLLTWSDPTALSATHVTKYHVYRLDPVTLFWTLIAEVPKHGTSYQDPSLSDGTDWQYKVTAVIK